jgi:hypothetical protein
MDQNIYLTLFRDISLYLIAVTIAAMFWHRSTVKEDQKLITE